MFNRILRAIKLDSSFYREVADNDSYMQESVIIVIAVAVLSGLGSMINSSRPVMVLLLQTASSLLFGWVLWSLVAYYVGTRFFHGKSSITEMLRGLGYANAPRLLSVFNFIPCIGPILSFAGVVLSVIAGVIAIRESMEFETSDAIVTALLGFLIFIVASAIIGIFVAGVFVPVRMFQNF